MPIEPQPEQQNGQTVRRPATVTPTEERLSLMDIWRTVVKQRLVILIVTAICFTLAVVYSFRTTPVYESTSRIEINPNNTPKVGLLTDAEQGLDTSANMIQTEILVLQSDSVILQTAQSLNLLDRLRSGNHKPGMPAAPVTGEIPPGNGWR